jgi:hypothetical protein
MGNQWGSIMSVPIDLNGLSNIFFVPKSYPAQRDQLPIPDGCVTLQVPAFSATLYRT